MVNVVDWFDASNLEHLKAYKYLGENAFWPKGFLPDFVEIGPSWCARITSKIADEFVNRMLNKQESRNVTEI